MAGFEEELASQIMGVGKKLLETPTTSVKELLVVLDRLEVYLSRVEQSPSDAIKSELFPVKNALVSERLLCHANVDVKVAVASCISEITRIAAPEVPYKDDQMKDAFKLIVSTFERLPDKSSRSYAKRISILDTVAKVRSCVVMLDLECDHLILVMFRHLINAIRDDHPENVFASMESIMMRVIDESEDISSDLLSCILEPVKKDNMEVTPVARKMMKKVIQKCADKLIPYIKTAVRTKELLPTDYDEVLSYLCHEISEETAGQLMNNEMIFVGVPTDANNPLEPSSDTIQNKVDMPCIVVSIGERVPADFLSELAAGNGTANVDVDTLSVSSTLQDSKCSNPDMVPDTVTAGSSVAVGNSGGVGVEADTKASRTTNPLTLDDYVIAEKIDGNSKSEPLAEKIVKKRGRKPKAKKKAIKSKLAGNQKSGNEPNYPLQRQESSNEAADHSSVNPMETDDISSKPISGDAGQSDKLDELCKIKTEINILENHTSVDMKATASAVCDLEERTATLKVDASEAKATSPQADMPLEKTNASTHENPKEDTVIPPSDAAPEGDAPLVDEPLEEVESSVGKSPEQLAGLSKVTHDGDDDPSKTINDIKSPRRSLRKAILQKHAARAGALYNHKDATTSRKVKSTVNEEDLKETPKSSTKRKRIEENKDESEDYGEELVGSKVKVWWPADKRYYKGVIESFDSAMKKHKVLYADGELEHLVLSKQRWEAINSDEDSDTESDEGTLDTASRKRHKGEEVNKGISRKRFGRDPSSKAKSASNKPGCKRHSLVKNDSKSSGGSKAGGKAKADNSKEEEKSEVKSVKKLGSRRADVSKSAGKLKICASLSSLKRKAGVSESAGKGRADVSRSTGKQKADVSMSAGKRRAHKLKSTAKTEPDVSKSASKQKADVSKSADKRGADTSKSMGKQKANVSKSARKQKAAVSKPSGKLRTNEAGKRNVKHEDPKGKGTELGKDTRLTKSARKSKSRERNKAKSTRKATPAAKRNIKTPSRKENKTSEKAESDSKERSRKRKATVLDRK